MRRAASSLVPITAGDLGVGGVGDEPQGDRGALLGRQLADARPQSPSLRRARGAPAGRCSGTVVRLGDRAAGAGAPTWSIALWWATVRIQLRRFERVAEPRVRAQRRKPRLLVAVVGVAAADGRDEEAMHVAPVGVEQLLERGKRHWG